MADETLRYRVEIDEASLTSELARTRGAITGAMQQAVQTGQYAVNSIHADLAMARQAMTLPGVPMTASPGLDLRSQALLMQGGMGGMGGAGFSGALASPMRDFGFMGAAGILAGRAVPTDMMSDDAQRMARMELEQRAFGMTAAIGRQAMPVSGALAGIGAGMGMGLGPLGSLGLGAAGYLGGDLLAKPIFDIMEQRQTTGEILSLTRAPHPMRPFSRDQREELTRGLAQDVAKDVRFGMEDMSQLLASGVATNAFAGTQNVEEFRTKFRAMMDQVKSITRVFQQSTEEALQTMGQLGQMGPAQGMGGRIADIHALSRMGGMPAQQAMEMGMGGARMAAGMGIPMAAGFDAMTRNAQMAVVGEAAGAFDPFMFRQMGGAQGIAAKATQFGFQASGALQQMLPAFANETMTGIDPSKVQQFISGQSSFFDLRQAAFEKMSDPTMRTRFAANADMLQNQLSISGQAGPAMFKMAEGIGGMSGVPAADVFNKMTAEMGLNYQERQMALTFSRDRGQLEGVANREREQAEYRIQLERHKEESRFSSRLGAKIEEWQTGISNTTGGPIKATGDWISGAVESVVTAPKRLLNWLDVTAGKTFFGDFGGPGMPTGMQGGMGARDVGDLVRTSGYLTAGDAGGGGGLSRLGVMRGDRMMSMAQAEKNFASAVRTVLWKSDIRGSDFKLAAKMTSEEQKDFEEEAVATFATDMSDLASEADPGKRKEKQADLGQRMTDWVKTRYGSAVSQDEIKDFTGKMFTIENMAQRDDVVRKGLESASHASAVIQTRNYAGVELPALLSASAAEGRGGEVAEVGKQIAAGFSGSPNGAALNAMLALGNASPMLQKDSALRGRAEVVRMITERGFLNPGDMELSSKELATVKAQNLSASQDAFVSELTKAAKNSEGHTLSADVLFKSVGMGLGGQAPSNTPGPAVGMDSGKWDLTAQSLDKLTGAVNNLSTASEKLLGMADTQSRRTAGKM